IETGDENFNTVGTQNTRRRFMSLTDGGSFAISQPTLFRAYSFYVLGRMLRERVGDYAFFAAIDQLGQGSTNRRVTTEDLRASLEATSGQDLEDFFAYWVRGGYIPEVTAEYRRETQPDGKVTVHACITTDVPFGSFDLPIAVGTGLPAKMPRKKEKALEVRERVADEAVGGMIEVVDGRAAFSVNDMQEGSTVLPDPFGLILAYSRTSKEVEQTTCDAEGIKPRGYEKG
ncbi:MAG: M1 family metallopeptidase, partial [Phycisphaeraceae bacterium]|nr:M1 family metallopeptidase [Phycisphaeraceae bacterium]